MPSERQALIARSNVYTVRRHGVCAGYGIGIGSTSDGVKIISELTDEWDLQSITDIAVGDEVLAINGTDVLPLTHEEAVSRITEANTFTIAVVKTQPHVAVKRWTCPVDSWLAADEGDGLTRRRLPLNPSPRGTGSARLYHRIHHFVYPVGGTPLLVFVNPKSGGQQGVKLLGEFAGLLSSAQVFNLLEPDPETGNVSGRCRFSGGMQRGCR